MQGEGSMPGEHERPDFFLSRRGSVKDVAQEVADVLQEKGYAVIVQDYDVPLGVSFIDKMHEAIKNARNLVILFTRDYEESLYTRKEFTSFEAERLQDGDRHIIVLRCQDVPLRGLLADNVYQDLVGVTDPAERKRRIIAAAERQSSTERPRRRHGRTFNVPPRIPTFMGRVDELDRLDAILTRDKPAAVTQVSRVAVQGLGGVGKTSLAVEYAHHFRGLYDGVWWCHAETRTTLLASLAAIATVLEAAPPDHADIEMAARAALRRLAEHRDVWLLVYDNLTAPEEISDLLPSAGARVLITSRFSDLATWAEEVPLDVLPIAEASEFLLSRAGSSDEAGARTLAETLGRLPLALDHAAATCKLAQMSFAAYATKASSLITSAPRGVGYPRSVAATFDLAIAEAVAQCPAVEVLAAFLAHCAPERVPMALVEGSIDDETVRMQALAAFAEVSLVKHDPFEDGTPAVIVHRLVQAVARTRSESKGAAISAMQQLIARLDAIYPDDGHNNPASWPRCASLTPHVQAIRTEMPDAGARVQYASLLQKTGLNFHGRAAFTASRPLYERSLAIREEVLGSEHPDTATSLNSLALLLQDQGDLAGARPLFERALAIRKKVHGHEHPDSAASLNNLADLLQDQGDFTAAGLLFKRALAIREKVLGREHPDTATSLSYLANLLRSKGKLAAARALCERALAIRRKVLGPGHLDTATSLNNLAAVLQGQGHLGRARPLYKRALEIVETARGAEHPDTATSLNNLAVLLHQCGSLAEARPQYERALAIREKVLGPEHRATATSLCNLAGLLCDQSDFAGARPLSERALAIVEKALGPDHPDTADYLTNIAELLKKQDDLAGARRLFKRARVIQKKLAGTERSKTASRRNYRARPRRKKSK
jgi:tetratricopeptide (TPR) repeat protein